jgi:DNA-binding MarR family transcriptional regulator
MASHEVPSPAGNAERARKHRSDTIELGVLKGHLGYFIRRLQVWVFQDFVRTLAPLRIRPAQYSVLVVIESNPGLSQADIAKRLGIERARLARLLDRLERRGFTRRLTAPNDRRSHALLLTLEGQKRMKQIKALAAEHEKHLMQKVGSAKWAMLIDILRDFDPTALPKNGFRSGR